MRDPGQSAPETWSIQMAQKIMLADDEEDIKVVMQLFLESKGYDIVTAFDGLDTIERAKQELPDLILLDVMMPVIDGFEVCKRLKADPATFGIPIIMVSAAGQAESRQKGLDAGAVDYVVKPFEPEQLIERIQATLKKE